MEDSLRESIGIILFTLNIILLIRLGLGNPMEVLMNEARRASLRHKILIQCVFDISLLAATIICLYLSIPYIIELDSREEISFLLTVIFLLAQSYVLSILYTKIISKIKEYKEVKKNAC